MCDMSQLLQDYAGSALLSSHSTPCGWRTYVHATSFCHLRMGELFTCLHWFWSPESEYHKLEGTHKNRDQLLSPHRTIQNPNPMSDSVAQTLLELWQLRAVILGSLLPKKQWTCGNERRIVDNLAIGRLVLPDACLSSAASQWVQHTASWCTLCQLLSPGWVLQSTSSW